MNAVCVLFAVALCFLGGQALQCYECKIGLWNLCITSKKVCADDEQCFSGTGKAAGFVDVKMKGCLQKGKCGMTEQINLSQNSSAQMYSMTRTCCSTELCNSALGQPHISAVTMTLTTISSLLALKLLM